MPSKPKPDLRFTITVKDEPSFGDPFLMFSAHVVYVLPGEGVRSPLFGSDREHGAHEFDSMLVSAQMSAGFGDAFYGYDAHFHQPFAVRLSQAEAMVRILRRVERRLGDLAGRFGYPEDLAAYMGRVAEAIGCPESRCFGIRSSESWDGTGYRWQDVDGLRHHLRREIKTWQDKHGIATPAAA